MDIPTLYLTASLILISLPIGLWAVVEPEQRRLPHLKFWCAGGLMFGIGVGLIGLRLVAPAALTVSLAFGLIDLGLLLRWQALRGVLNRPQISWLSIGVLALAFCLAVEWGRSTAIIPWPLVAYPIQLVMACILMRECSRIVREQHSVAARWLLFSYLFPCVSVAAQLVIFLMSPSLPITAYPAQSTPITGVTMVFLAVISNFAFLGILSERMASHRAAEVKRAEREAVLREFEARLSRLHRMQSLGAVAGSLAHELTQPLMAILSNTQLAETRLQRSEFTVEHQAELLQSTLRSARRGAAILERIRRRLQPQDPVLGTVDLAWVNNDVIDLMTPLLKTNRVELDTRIPAEPVYVTGDPIELSQVLVILLTNAIESCEAAAPRIEVTLQAGAGRVSWSVRDHGPGFSVEMLTNASEALFTTKPGGLGLGLVIATTILRQHRGTLRLANAPGGGAIAVVDLPQTFPSHPSAGNPDEAKNQRTA